MKSSPVFEEMQALNTLLELSLEHWRSMGVSEEIPLIYFLGDGLQQYMTGSLEVPLLIESSTLCLSHLNSIP